MNRAELSSISSSTILIDAKLGEQRMRQAKQCPNCGHTLERKPDWVGLPAGVKFDPTDQELIEHLEGKVKSESRSHPLIDEFIPTIEGDDGICYTHPEKLPGVTRDGLSRHFFHRPSKAYTTGTRKRRKIQTECHFQGGETRWHKTGKTRPVMANGSQKGCKKILVLYTNFGKNRKAEKTNWVMHQYHLGQLEEEREGELVVSKIFYQTQPRQCNLGERVTAAENIGKRESGKAAMLQREEMASVGAMLSRYGSLELPQLKGEHFGFSPFRRSFDEGGMDEAASPRPRETSAHTCKDGDDEERRRQVTQEQHCQATASAASFHVSRPCNVILSPAPLHHPPLVLDDPYSVSRLLLPPDKFQQQQHKLLDRSTSGLEDLIMSCTRTDIKGEISISTSQETTEWLKNSYWPYPDNPDQHS